MIAGQHYCIRAMAVCLFVYFKYLQNKIKSYSRLFTASFNLGATEGI